MWILGAFCHFKSFNDILSIFKPRDGVFLGPQKMILVWPSFSAGPKTWQWEKHFPENVLHQNERDLNAELVSIIGIHAAKLFFVQTTSQVKEKEPFLRPIGYSHELTLLHIWNHFEILIHKKTDHLSFPACFSDSHLFLSLGQIR